LFETDVDILKEIVIIFSRCVKIYSQNISEFYSSGFLRVERRIVVKNRRKK